jgi:hypothetical protein
MEDRDLMQLGKQMDGAQIFWTPWHIMTLPA